MRIPLLFLLFLGTICVAQTPVTDSTASVSGRVTVGGKGASGITVTATLSSSPLEKRTIARVTTDDDGIYHLTGLPAGRFTITPIAKAFVLAANDTFKQSGQTVNVAEKESITAIDFALVRGGVITGRITDLEGHPIIGERINVVAKSESSDSGPVSFLSGRRNQTDDRGVYRIYGLAPGSYRVSVGQAAGAGGVNIGGVGGSQYAKTFYPGVTDQSKATTIEVNEGAVVTDIDITPGKPSSGFSVTGRTLDAESGKPVSGAFIGYSSTSGANQQLGDMNFSGIQTDANGKFRLEGIQPGHYAVFIMGIGQEKASYSDSMPFDISDSDVTGIEILVRRGATIEGVAVIENNVDPAVAALLQSISLIAYVANEKSAAVPSYSRGTINPDGSFRFAGLAPGKARISVMAFGTSSPKGIRLVRTELQGLDQTDGIVLTAGADLKGVRLVFAYGIGKIRGEVRVEGGALPDGTAFAVSLHTLSGGAEMYPRLIEVDARGHFVAEDIPPGTYELTIRPRGGIPAFEPVTRTITIANGAETQVILVVNLAGKKVGP